MIAVVTLPDKRDKEIEALSALCRAEGITIHLRREDPRRIAEAVGRICKNSPRLLDRFVIHHSPGLAERYGFGGTHRRFSQRDDGYYGRLSVSCHSFDEARTVLDEGRADYLFLSPLFDSRSKRGYLSAFTHEETAAFMGTLSPDEKRRVIALGGVDADNIALCRDMGFGGAAMIGSVWALHNGVIDPEATLSNYEKLEKIWSQERE